MFDRNSLIGFVGVQDSSQLPTLRPDEIRLVEKVVRQCATHIALLELDELRKTQRLAVVTSGEGHP
jgi:GAF domain-containing protein